MTSSLHFIAIVLPPDLQEKIRSLQQEIADRFHSQAALKSPPHITLIPPLNLSEEQVKSLDRVLINFCQFQAPIVTHLANFAAFAPRVLYVHVEASSVLRNLQTHLKKHLQNYPELHLPQTDRHKHSFTPHVTIGFRDLSAENFHRAWSEFQGRSFTAQFTAQEITLLHHTGQYWERRITYPLGIS